MGMSPEAKANRITDYVRIRRTEKRDPEKIHSALQKGLGIEHPEEDIEYEPLEKIHDYYPKYIMSLDKLLRKRSGIKHRNVFEFMENGQMF